MLSYSKSQIPILLVSVLRLSSKPKSGTEYCITSGLRSSAMAMLVDFERQLGPPASLSGLIFFLTGIL